MSRINRSKRRVGELFGIVVLATWATSVDAWTGPGVAVPPLSEGFAENITAFDGDGSGGSLLTWEQNGFKSQYLNRNGTPLWETGGREHPVYHLPYDYLAPAPALPDGSGGMIYVHEELDQYNNRTYDIRRSDSQGNLNWKSPQVGYPKGWWWPSCSIALRSVAFLPDGDGGVLWIWQRHQQCNDGRLGYTNYYADRVSSQGVVLWTRDVRYYGSYTLDYSMSVTTDGAGGIVLAWTDDSVVFAQRVDAAGTVLWPYSGIRVSANGLGRLRANQVGLSASGEFCHLVWGEDKPEQGSLIRAQCLSRDGVFLWGDGIVIAESENLRLPKPGNPVSVGGQAIVAWTQNDQLFAQKISSSGEPLWGDSEVRIHSGPVGSYSITGDMHGGMYAVFGFLENQAPHLAAQHVSVTGQLLWEPVPYLGQIPGSLGGRHLIGDGRGGILSAWIGSDLRVRANRLPYVGTRHHPEQTLRINSQEHFWQTISYNYATQEASLSPLTAFDGNASVKVIPETYSGVFLYDYERRRFVEALYWFSLGSW